MTINELKSRGLRVYVSHKRKYYKSGPLNGKISYYPYLSKREAAELKIPQENLVATGGYTEISVYNGEDTERTTPVAYANTVCSKDDSFNRKRALQIVLGRIEKELGK